MRNGRDAFRQAFRVVRQTPMASLFRQMAGNAVVKAGDVLNGVFVPDADADDVNHMPAPPPKERPDQQPLED